MLPAQRYLENNLKSKLLSEEIKVKRRIERGQDWKESLPPHATDSTVSQSEPCP